jgi:hypothetical protein
MSVEKMDWYKEKKLQEIRWKTTHENSLGCKRESFSKYASQDSRGTV